MFLRAWIVPESIAVDGWEEAAVTGGLWSVVAVFASRHHSIPREVTVPQRLVGTTPSCVQSTEMWSCEDGAFDLNCLINALQVPNPAPSSDRNLCRRSSLSGPVTLNSSTLSVLPGALVPLERKTGEHSRPAIAARRVNTVGPL